MFKGRLEKLRKERGLSQAELSSRIGIARTTYSGYENGAREPDHSTLKKIADFFDVSIDYLLGVDKPMNINDQAKNQVIEEYSRLPQEKKKLVDDLIKALLDDRTKK